MTISSSLNSGVAGLQVNASRLATIADNIANSGTYGYKRVVADFHSLVIMQSDGSYSAGGVRASTSRMIDQRGTLVTTNNPTDLAIGGRGMVPVTSAAALNGPANDLPVRLMTTGSFRPDAEGILRTQTGEVLMGWPANADGTIPNFPRDTFDGLQPIVINTNQFAGDPTTFMELSVNLPATSTDASGDGQPFVMSAEYYDNLGASQYLEITFSPTVPPTGMSHQWNMEVRDSASAGAVVGQYTVTFDDARGNGGNLDSVAVVSGGGYDLATGTIALTVDGGALDLALDPPELGRLRLSFTEINGMLTLVIAAERPETADLMRRNFGLLIQEFARAGVDAPMVSISDGGGGGRHDPRPARSGPDALVHGDLVDDTVGSTRPIASRPMPLGNLDLRV